MGKNINNGKRETVESMYNSMLRYYIGQMKREDFYKDGSCERLYQWMVSKITNEIEQDPSKAEDYRKILAMFDRFYEVVTDEKVRNKVKSEIILEKEFTKLYGSRILGEFKRKYDMSHKYIEGAVASKNGQYGESKKDMAFDAGKRDATPEKFSNGTRTIFIRQSGELDYTSGFMVKNNKVKQYKISIQGDNTAEEYYVFSEGIDLQKMKADPEYCSAVLDELLSKNNINLSNVGYYIGSVTDTRKDSKPLQVGTQREDGLYGDYEYQISENYKLVYDAQNLSAVMDYVNERTNEQSR